MNSTSGGNVMRARLANLLDWEQKLRAKMLAAGCSEWAFGDSVKAILVDAQNLVARVEELEAELAKREPEADPLRSALIGILRADGYEVTAPGGTRRLAVDVNIKGNPNAALRYFTSTLEKLSADAPFDHDAAASDMLGEDEPDDPPWPSGPTVIDRAGGTDVCPSCEKPLPPDGKCRSPYVDCQRSSAPRGQTMLGATQDDAAFEASAPLENGAAVRIVGGLWDGRYAVALGTFSGHGKRHCVQATARGTEFVNADPIEATGVYVVNPDVDEPTKGETPAAKLGRSRSPEPPKLVTEWAPDGRDFEGYARELPLSASQLEAMLPDFRQFVLSANPNKRQARWGGAFKDWAKSRLAATT